MRSWWPIALRGYLLLAVGVALVWSGVDPYDRLTWWLEIAPILIAVPVLVASRQRVPLTQLLCVLLAFHALILIVGGHYTYARVPIGFWLQDAFDFSRNHYDRLGHFAQGFVPAILARELLLRRAGIRPGFWLVLVTTLTVLGFSAFYELTEWWAAVVEGSAAQDFLGTQGDIWDTQWDMFMALLGAVTAQLALWKIHNRQIDNMGDRPCPAGNVK